MIHGWRSKLARVAKAIARRPARHPLLQLRVVDELTAEDRVAHQVEQLVLAAHVVVEAHGPEPELARRRGASTPPRSPRRRRRRSPRRRCPRASWGARRPLGSGRAQIGSNTLLLGVPAPACRDAVALGALDISYSVLLPYAVRITVHRTNEELSCQLPTTPASSPKGSASATATSGRCATSTSTSPRARCSACSATTAPARPPPCAS